MISDVIRPEFWNINIPEISRLGWNTDNGGKETRESIQDLIFKIRGSAKFFCKGSDSKYFWLCVPCGLCSVHAAIGNMQMGVAIVFQ